MTAGPRHRPADHRRADHHRGQPAVRPARRRVPARAPGVGDAGRGAVRAGRACSPGAPRWACSSSPSGSTRPRPGWPGVRARGITVAVYVFVAVCACVAGLMISSNVTAADANNAGLWIELDAILAVVIGGTLLTGGRFSIIGTLVGALVLQTLTTTVYTAGIPPEVTLVFKALVIIAVCLLQSPKTRALLRRRAARRRCARRWPRRRAPTPPAPPRRPRPRAAPAPRRRLASPRVLPVLATFVLFVVMFGVGSVRYDGFFSLPGAAQPVHRQRLPDRARRRHDLRDHHRRHRPVASARWWRSPACSRRSSWPAGGARCGAARRAARRHLAGPRDGPGDPLPGAAAVRGHAGGHVPRPRALLRDQRRVHPDPRPAVHRRRPGHRVAARRHVRQPVGRGRGAGRAGRAPTCCTPPGSAARCTPWAATSSRPS